MTTATENPHMIVQLLEPWSGHNSGDKLDSGDIGYGVCDALVTGGRAKDVTPKAKMIKGPKVQNKAVTNGAG